MSKKSAAGLILIVIVGLFMFWPTPNSKAILGKWQSTNKTQAVTFIADGTIFVQYASGIQKAGIYKFVENNKIRVEIEKITDKILGALDPIIPGVGVLRLLKDNTPPIYEISFRNGRLFLKDLRGRSGWYRKIK